MRKEGKATFEARMEQAQPLSTFLFNSLLPQVDLSSPDGSTQLATGAAAREVRGDARRIQLRQTFGAEVGAFSMIVSDRFSA